MLYIQKVRLLDAFSVVHAFQAYLDFCPDSQYLQLVRENFASRVRKCLLYLSEASDK